MTIAATEPTTESRRPAAPLNSMTAGLIIHRVGCVNSGFLDEARKFSTELTNYMNARVNSGITTVLFDEVDGNPPRLHWLVHMITPTNYRRLLHMVDHDKAFREIYESDRLPERGGGNWEKMFLQGSFREVMLLPQHGFARHGSEEADPESFVPPARHQIANGGESFLHSQNAGALVIRSFHAQYESRDLARFYLSEWQAVINRKGAGAVTCGQYEQIWGYQDRLSLLIHLRSLEDYKMVQQIEASDPEMRAVMERPRVNLRGQELGWTGLFEPGSPYDTVLKLIR